jgi:hypothetical protein
MDEETSSKVRSYMQLKVEILEKEMALNELKPQVLQAMLDYNGPEAKVSSSLGKLSVQAREKWTYPQALVQAREDLKIAEKNARREGHARAEVSHILFFKASTEEDVEEPVLEV